VLPSQLQNPAVQETIGSSALNGRAAALAAHSRSVASELTLAPTLLDLSHLTPKLGVRAA